MKALDIPWGDERVGRLRWALYAVCAAAALFLADAVALALRWDDTAAATRDTLALAIGLYAVLGLALAISAVGALRLLPERRGRIWVLVAGSLLMVGGVLFLGSLEGFLVLLLGVVVLALALAPNAPEPPAA